MGAMPTVPAAFENPFLVFRSTSFDRIRWQNKAIGLSGCGPYPVRSGLVIIGRKMKRLFALLLMFVLPLQISWAVAGSYCEHEQSSATQHFGHHAHVHQAQPDDPDSKSPLQSHPDCSSCHHISFSALGDGANVAFASQARAIAPQPASAFPSVPPGEPERPKWHLVA